MTRRSPPPVAKTTFYDPGHAGPQLLSQPGIVWDADKDAEYVRRCLRAFRGGFPTGDAAKGRAALAAPNVMAAERQSLARSWPAVEASIRGMGKWK